MLSTKSLFQLQKLIITADSIRGQEGVLRLPNDDQFKQKFYSFIIREMRKVASSTNDIVEIERCIHTEDMYMNIDTFKKENYNGEVVLDNPRLSGGGNKDANPTKNKQELKQWATKKVVKHNG